MPRPAVAYINLSHLRHNYRLLAKRAGDAEVMAVIKANAYGHGLSLVAPALLQEGCHSFAVTDAVEGALLREIVGMQASITLLSGIFDANDAGLCRQHRLSPSLTTLRQVELLAAEGFSGKVWLKVDTGMRRLGAVDAAGLCAACTHHGMRIAGLMSHLACADTDGHAMNSRQVADFRAIASTLPAGTRLSLLNSAGLVTLPGHAFDVVRPGIALYGAEPLPGKPLGLKPVMRLCGQVIQVRNIRSGESVSYGASFTADRDTRIATVAMGYADGLPRLLSNRGRAAGGNAILPIVGRVCMDYCLLDASDTDIMTGAEMEFWGDELSANAVADSIGTIAYELFTGVGGRILRQAIE